MSDNLNDPEIQRQFAATRQANERRRQLQEEEQARVQSDLAAVSARMAEDQRRRLAEQLDDGLRDAFFAGNPTASDADWQRLASQIRDEYMKSAAAQVPANVFTRIRSQAHVRQQEELDRRDRLNRLS